MTLDEISAAVQARSSTRGFRPDPIPHDLLESIFAVAQFAPSWCNVQPWRAVVASPPGTAALASAMQAAARSASPSPEVPFPSFPPPYDAHRRDCGVALYQAMGIARDDKAGRYDAWLRNYAFFDAPHVAVVSCDRRLGPYAYVDVGVWLGLVLSGAAAAGIGTCPMASIATYPSVLRSHLQIPDEEIILFGIALGWRDDTVPANAARTKRAPVGANIRFV